MVVTVALTVAATVAVAAASLPMAATIAVAAPRILLVTTARSGAHVPVSSRTAAAVGGKT